MKRKLTTIFYADGVGYASLMEGDEDGTLARLKRARAVMGEIFAAHEGRQVNTWGDAVIAEFPSVVEAVRAAIAIQDAIVTENLDVEPGRRMLFRIGINLGDVLVDGADIYGDGVNVAARLCELAEPGGIVISGTVHSLVCKLLAVGFDYAGAEQVRGLEEPVPSYRVVMPGRNAPAGDRLRPEPPHPGPPAGPGELRLPDPAPLFAGLSRHAEALRAWLLKQPRGVQVASFLIAFLFAINLLFTGIATPWFIFPAAPFALYIFLKQRRPDG
jgi:adenylate cyclase